MADKLVVKTPKQLYRFLLRQVAQLPEDARNYYKHKIRQEYVSYADETDAERVQQIIARAVQDSKWVTEKYKTK